MSTITVQLTAMSIVAEDTPSAFFETTRYDSGIYGDHDEAAPGLPNDVAEDNCTWLRYGPHDLYEGWLEAPQQTFTADERWYVPAGSYLARGKRHGMFGRIFKDSDIAQWRAFKDVPTWAQMRNSGDKFRLINTAGTVIGFGHTDVVHPLMVYWLADGLRTDHHIDALSFTLTEVGTVDTKVTLGVCTWTDPPADGATITSEATYLYNDAGGAKSLTFSGDVQAVGFFIMWNSTNTTPSTADNGWDVTDIVVTTSASAAFSGGTPELGQAMAQLATEVGIAADHALHSYSDTTISTLAARPVTTVSAAQESLAAAAAVPLKWGYEAGGWFDTEDAGLPDRTLKTDRARWWSITHADCTYTSDVVENGDGFYDFVAVLYAAIGVTGVDDGMPRVCYRPATPTATDRVAVLDYRGRYLTTTEAEHVGDQFLLWCAPGSGGTGNITVAGDIRDVDGHVRAAIIVRPGDWIEERERRGHTPWLITGVRYDASGTVSISVGGAERQFAAVPGLAGIFTDAPLALATAGGGVAGSGSGGSPEEWVAAHFPAPYKPQFGTGPNLQDWLAAKAAAMPETPSYAPEGEPYPGYYAGLGSPDFKMPAQTEAPGSETNPQPGWEIW